MRWCVLSESEKIRERERERDSNNQKSFFKRVFLEKRNNFEFFPSVADRLGQRRWHLSIELEGQRKLIADLSRLILIANKLLMNDKNKLIGCHHGPPDWLKSKIQPELTNSRCRIAQFKAQFNRLRRECTRLDGDLLPLWSKIGLHFGAALQTK